MADHPPAQLDEQATMPGEDLAEQIGALSILFAGLSSNLATLMQHPQGVTEANKASLQQLFAQIAQLCVTVHEAATALQHSTC